MGTLKGPGNPGNGPKWDGLTFNRYIATHFPNSLTNGAEVPDATGLYRRLLAQESDKTLVIVSTGFLTNLRNLLDSKPDQASPLSGVELVRRRVQKLVVMGGGYPKGKKEDPNLFGDLPASQEVLSSWPTPIMFSGVEVGESIKTGSCLSTETPPTDPVRVAYELWDEHFWPLWDKAYRPGVIRPHPSYDQTAALYAVRGLTNYWVAHTNGFNRLFPNGSNEWSPTPHRGQGYLSPRLPPEELARIIEDLMVQSPVQKRLSR